MNTFGNIMYVAIRHIHKMSLGRMATVYPFKMAKFMAKHQLNTDQCILMSTTFVFPIK